MSLETNYFLCYDQNVFNYQDSSDFYDLSGFFDLCDPCLLMKTRP